jgi:enoyl-CoA hydratase/carnithine racemase
MIRAFEEISRPGGQTNEWRGAILSPFLRVKVGLLRIEWHNVLMQYQHLLVTSDGHITTVSLNRPDKRNALALNVMRELTEALRAIAHTDALGVILAANGPVFSAGHNFADMAGATLEQSRELFLVCTEMMNTIQSLPQPVVARVHALATAGGCQLVASCDLAVAADTAAFAIPGGKAGLFCHTPLVAVARNIGRKRALELALTGDAIDAATAADWGLINKAVPPDQLEAVTLDLIQRATRGSALSKALGKQAFYRQVDLPQPAAYEYAVERMATASLMPDAQEGISAFLEKRVAQYVQRPGEES